MTFHFNRTAELKFPTLPSLSRSAPSLQAFPHPANTCFPDSEERKIAARPDKYPSSSQQPAPLRRSRRLKGAGGPSGQLSAGAPRLPKTPALREAGSTPGSAARFPLPPRAGRDPFPARREGPRGPRDPSRDPASHRERAARQRRGTHPTPRRKGLTLPRPGGDRHRPPFPAAAAAPRNSPLPLPPAHRASTGRRPSPGGAGAGAGTGARPAPVRSGIARSVPSAGGGGLTGGGCCDYASRRASRRAGTRK